MELIVLGIIMLVSYLFGFKAGRKHAMASGAAPGGHNVEAGGIKSITKQ
jgi:hypothetical protein